MHAPKLLALACALATMASAGIAEATPRFGAWDATSVFFIGKSENKNEVHYGVHLDARCNVVGDQPVFAYWQMKEAALPRVEDLLPREEAGYGIASQIVTGMSVRITLRALPDRPIVLSTTKTDSGCSTTAHMPIGQAHARLDHVFVQLAWPFGVSYLKVFGTNDAGMRVEEKIAK
jgi:hypothetical protein